MAWRAGAAVANMEFIQFHPTALYPVGVRPFLISEAVRGEGAVLRDHEGRSIMEGRVGGDLAARDVVARVIDARLRDSGQSHVWLDARSIAPARFAERFPNILESCRERGFDPPEEWLPVVPAAHYACGGVLTDLEARTRLHGLLAAGEVACTGVHGANRLASNSLLEAVVFADRAATTTGRLLAEASLQAPLPPARRPRRGGDPDALRERVRDILWTGAGIVRSDAGLAEARTRLLELSTQVPVQPLDPAAAEAANLHLVGRLIVASATLRRESRGLHFTRSHPELDPAQRRDTVLVPREYSLEGA
jgi:L-aspartate oxidase